MRAIVLSLAAFCTAALIGCEKSAAPAVVTLYCSVDEPFAREVVAAFEKQTGIRVNLKTDTEAGKTTGLVRRIEAERAHPQADVFWSSELFNTIKMAGDGLLAEYRPPAEGIPDRYKDPAGKWTAFGLRARVLGCNTQKLKQQDVPDEVAGHRRCALGRATGRLPTRDSARPAGTSRPCTRSGARRSTSASSTPSRRRSAGVCSTATRPRPGWSASGELLICATDTDDVYARQERKEPIDLVYPDMGDGGTLLIPNSVGLIAGAPHPETARKLIDFLCSEQTEGMLARSESRNIPVRESLRAKLKMEMPPSSKVDFQKVTDNMERAIQLAGERLVK